MTNEQRILNLQSLGYTPTESRFLVVAALHSGHFVRRQFCDFAHCTRGGAETRFIEKLEANRQAESTTYRSSRVVYRLASRRLYEALGEGDNRHRRACQTYTIRHKLIQLDFVLSRPNARFLATLDDRLDYFDQRGVSRQLLPSRCYSSANGTVSKMAFFPDRSPILIDDSLAQPVASFVFLNDGDFAYRDLRAFLASHRNLFGALDEFKLIYVAADRTFFAKARKLFGKFLWSEGGSAAELLAHFGDRRAFERRETRGWDKPRIDHFRDQRDQFTGAHFDALYQRWKTEGDSAVTSHPSSLNGTIETEILTHTYDLFGGQSHAA
jgi:hypothetical protein